MDFVLSSDRSDFHERALGHLFREVDSHPLLQGRQKGYGAESGVTARELLQRLEPHSTEDHRDAILRVGPYAGAFSL